MRRLYTFFRLSQSNRQFLVKTMLLLVLFHILTQVVPLRVLIIYLRPPRQRPQKEETDQHADLVQQIEWAIEVVNRHLPKPIPCLAQAVTAQYLLARRGYSATLYIGVKKDAQGALCGHAWLQSAGWVVTGGHDLDCYTIVTAFQ